MQKDLEKITNFLHTINGLNHILRFKDMPKWENVNIERWNSVAEHSYRMALMAVMYKKYLGKEIDLEKTLKIILVHDIVELIAKDYSPIKGHNGAGGHAFNEKAYEDKYMRENEAAKELFSDLPNNLRDEFISLSKEYAEKKLSPDFATEESKYAYALDKIEAQIQMVDWKDDIDWDKNRTEDSYSYSKEWCNYNETLRKVNNILRSEMENMEK